MKTTLILIIIIAVVTLAAVIAGFLYSAEVKRRIAAELKSTRQARAAAAANEAKNVQIKRRDKISTGNSDDDFSGSVAVLSDIANRRRNRKN